MALYENFIKSELFSNYSVMTGSNDDNIEEVLDKANTDSKVVFSKIEAITGVKNKIAISDDYYMFELDDATPIKSIYDSIVEVLHNYNIKNYKLSYVNEDGVRVIYLESKERAERLVQQALEEDIINKSILENKQELNKRLQEFIDLSKTEINDLNSVKEFFKQELFHNSDNYSSRMKTAMAYVIREV